MSLPHTYSALDRAVHRLAFGGAAAQATAADVEALIYGSRFRHVNIERPLFVTSLPRAGTTLLLDILAQVPGLASHTYRDMPFVLAPILWDSMTRGFRKPAEQRERAHGDGMEVGYDSPEAFEEILWRASWPDRYHPDHIDLWPASDAAAADFGESFADHMRRIVYLRTGGAPGSRYVSKNNANIARIELLRRLFPDCVILVPLRHPLAQAASLLQQHRRFGELHAQDEFARRYMHDIGHLEFGQLHRPIAFPGMEDVRRTYAVDAIEYWVAYWERAFSHLATLQENVVLVSYEGLCADGGRIVPLLAERLHVSAADLSHAAGTRLHAPRRSQEQTLGDSALARRVDDLYESLLAASVGFVAGSR